jgi:hypothetical protein
MMASRSVPLSDSTPTAHAFRQNKVEGILGCFLQNLNRPISSAWLHREFGSGFRSRYSEINSGDYPITILNETTLSADGEVSIYTAIPRELARSSAQERARRQAKARLRAVAPGLLLNACNKGILNDSNCLGLRELLTTAGLLTAGDGD